jgi:NAD-dependent DNA ligase
MFEAITLCIENNLKKFLPSVKTCYIIVSEIERKAMKIISPTDCPSCGSNLELVNDQLFCRNTDDCPAQSTKKLQNFCKKLKMKGFGEVTLEKLGLVSFNDLLDLDDKQAISRGLSEHMANKLIDVIQTRLELGISPNDFLAAMSIPLIGDGAMRKLSFDKIEDITYDTCKNSGIGDKAARNLIEWIDHNNNTIVRWSNYFKIIKSQTPTESNGYVLCITGKLIDFKNRSEAGKFLEARGYEVKTSVTKAVTHLICEDGTTGSSYQKAIKNGIIITTIKNLLEDNNT